MRDILITIGLALAAVVVGGILYRYAPGVPAVPHAAPNIGIPISFTELAHGNQSTIMARTNYLITSDSELRQLWRMLDQQGSAPVVNFATDDVIAVFAGQESAAGFSIAVSSVADGAARTVTITLRSPGASCLSAEERIAPYQIISVPKSSLPLTHEDIATTTSCLR